MAARGSSQACSVKRVLDAWEPEEFREMLANLRPLVFGNQVLDEPETLKVSNQHVRDVVDLKVAGWANQPSSAMKGAFYIVAMYVQEDFVWSAMDDILVTRIP
jgi:hypothetical protein